CARTGDSGTYYSGEYFDYW
nr:immunoglobulin heavy chain junction region [Macaca mulatta]MOX64505.1 immunoglobulin heavy chain junction region [Macaca mulatta]